MISKILSWFGIYWYEFKDKDGKEYRVYASYLEEARRELGTRLPLQDTNDPSII